jgi:hypothetical protein
MKRLFRVLLLGSVLQFATLSSLCAEAAKTYQVTGPVLELSDKTIVVQKGDEKWEIARDEKTRIDGVLKVGNKVTIHYRMTAVSVEARNENAEQKKKGK